MCVHAWPGNVRELEHWIESAIVLAPDGRIGVAHLPGERRGLSSSDLRVGTQTEGVPLGLTLDEAIRRYVTATVDACDGNKAEAARRLGLGRNTVGRIMKGELPEREPS